MFNCKLLLGHVHTCHATEVLFCVEEKIAGHYQKLLVDPANTSVPKAIKDKRGQIHHSYRIGCLERSGSPQDVFTSAVSIKRLLYMLEGEEKQLNSLISKVPGRFSTERMAFMSHTQLTQFFYHLRKALSCTICAASYYCNF